MRVIVSVVGLLVVVAIVGMLAKKQLQAVQPLASGAASVPAPSGTPAQQSRQLQRQVGDDVNKALEQGARRNEDEGSK